MNHTMHVLDAHDYYGYYSTVDEAAYRLTMNGCCAMTRMSFSLLTCSTCFILRMLAFAKAFIAQYSFVIMLRTNSTRPNVPSPTTKSAILVLKYNSVQRLLMVNGWVNEWKDLLVDMLAT